MAKAYKREITTPEQKAIYDALKAKRAEAEQARKELDDHYRVYHRIEGKYSIGTKPDEWAGQGCRGFFYEYNSPADRRREIDEEEKYYDTYIKPLKEKVSSLTEECIELDEALCVALWGFGSRKYYLIQQKAEFEKEIKRYQALIEEIDEKLSKTP
jgi:hypothetical protein